MSMNPGGRLHVDIVTVTGGATSLEEFPVKFKVEPAARTVSEITSSAAIPATISFLDLFIAQAGRSMIVLGLDPFRDVEVISAAFNSLQKSLA